MAFKSGHLQSLTASFRVHRSLTTMDFAVIFLLVLSGCSIVSGTCPTGKFGPDCLVDCHCANNATCDGYSGYCSGSSGQCADWFKSDTNTTNCQTGIIEFQMLTIPNQGQDVAFSCAATSGDALLVEALVLISDESEEFPLTDNVTEGNVLNNTYIASGLTHNQWVYCYLLHDSGNVWKGLLVPVYVPPLLSQPPAVVAGRGSVTVSWQAWGSHDQDSGDGPIIRYIVYQMISPNTWTPTGQIQVTDQSQYSFVVQPLEPTTQYQFSVVAVRDGPGGQGPLSPASQWISPLPTPPPTTEGPTTTESSTRVSLQSSSLVPSSLATTVPGASTNVPSSGVTRHIVTKPSTAAGSNSVTTEPTATEKPTNAGISETIIIALACGVFVCVVVVIGSIVACCLSKRRRQRTPKPRKAAGKLKSSTYQHTISRDRPTSQAGAATPYEEIGLPSWARDRSIPWQSMTVGDKVLHKGYVGEVVEGAVKIEGVFRSAAIKKLKADVSTDEHTTLMAEFRALTIVGRHQNVVNFLGACQHDEILHVVIEYLPNGDLRSYLRTARSTRNTRAPLSSRKRLGFALDVAKGMQHIASCGVVQRDLAARNILLGKNMVAKISNHGLVRKEDTYIGTSKTRQTSRWLSPESLTSMTYTSQSNVWSFGIVLWEIATLGGTPYESIKLENLLSKLKSRYRLPKPSNCDEEFYDLMLLCWQGHPANRPDFDKLVTRLTSLAGRT